MTNKLLPDDTHIDGYLKAKAAEIMEKVSDIAYDMVENEKYNCTLLISDTLDDDTSDMMRQDLAIEIEVKLREELKNLLLK
jgi:hypothetical protein